MSVPESESVQAASGLVVSVLDAAAVPVLRSLGERLGFTPAEDPAEDLGAAAVGDASPEEDKVRALPPDAAAAAALRPAPRAAFAPLPALRLRCARFQRRFQRLHYAPTTHPTRQYKHSA